MQEFIQGGLIFSFSGSWGAVEPRNPLKNHRYYKPKSIAPSPFMNTPLFMFSLKQTII